MELQMRKMLIGLVLAGLSNNVMAEWTRIVESEDHEYITYANLDTIRRKGDIAKMWTLIDYKTVQQPKSGERYLSDESQEEYDCREEQTRNVIYTWYSGNMSGGDRVYSNSSLRQWSPVRPGSIGEAWLKIACGITK